MKNFSLNQWLSIAISLSFAFSANAQTAFFKTYEVFDDNQYSSQVYNLQARETTDGFELYSPTYAQNFSIQVDADGHFRSMEENDLRSVSIFDPIYRTRKGEFVYSIQNDTTPIKTFRIVDPAGDLQQEFVFHLPKGRTIKGNVEELPDGNLLAAFTSSDTLPHWEQTTFRIHYALLNRANGLIENHRSFETNVRSATIGRLAWVEDYFLLQYEVRPFSSPYVHTAKIVDWEREWDHSPFGSKRIYSTWEPSTDGGYWYNEGNNSPILSKHGADTDGSLWWDALQGHIAAAISHPQGVLTLHNRPNGFLIRNLAQDGTTRNMHFIDHSEFSIPPTIRGGERTRDGEFIFWGSVFDGTKSIPCILKLNQDGEWDRPGYEPVSYTHLTLPTTPYV